MKNNYLIFKAERFLNGRGRAKSKSNISIRIPTESILMRVYLDSRSVHV